MIEREDPKRLLDGGASDLERSLIGAIAGERPSPELRDRMVRALGVSLATAGLAATVTASQTAASTKTAASIGAGAGGTAPLAWISAGVVSLMVAGAIIGVGASDVCTVGRMPQRLFHGLVPVYTELSVLLEHRGYEGKETGGMNGRLARAGQAVGAWAGARLARLRGKYAFREVESELSFLACSEGLCEIPDLEVSAIPDVEEIFRLLLS